MLERLNHVGATLEAGRGHRAERERPLGGEAGTRLDEIPLSAVEVLERLRWCLKSCARLQFMAELDREPSRDPETVDACGLSAALLAVQPASRPPNDALVEPLLRGDRSETCTR